MRQGVPEGVIRAAATDGDAAQRLRRARMRVVTAAARAVLAQCGLAVKSNPARWRLCCRNGRGRM